MHRFAARTGSAIAILVLLATAVVRAETVSYAFQHSSLTFTHVARTAEGTAVGVDDPAFRTLLKSLGAVLTWRPGDRYVMISTSSPEIVSFAVGDAHYSVGALTAAASFAPYLQGDEVYLPFDDAMRALGIAPQDGVLERLLTSVDVEGFGLQAVVIARGAGVLRPRVVSDESDRVAYAFDGVGTTLTPQRSVNAGGIRTIEITSSGSARNPQTLVTLDLQPGTRHDAPQFGSGEFEVAFGANGSAPPLVEPLRGAVAQAVPVTAQTPVPQSPPSAPPSSATPSPTIEPSTQPAQGATVTAVTVAAASDGSQTVTISVNGNASYDWHRLRAPDNRFWIDVHGAQLAQGPQDQDESGPLTAMRVRQLDPQTVRVALSIAGDNDLTVSPSMNGVAIDVGVDEVADQPRSGSGTVGSVVSANEPQTLVTPVPADEYGMNQPGDRSDWKFAPRGYTASDPKLIVLDPGHGGGDRGSMHGDLQEAVLTLDMAKRVQVILVARGWEVRMTRTADYDVKETPASTQEAIKYGFRDSDAYDLQARDDIANDAGARLFVSIHCNAYINSGPNGTTIYYTKPTDLSLAQLMDRDLALGGLGTKDDGIVHAHYYVTAHANMPAILIETAFLSNPSDYAKLDSPQWRQKMAEAIADGIDQYMRQYPVAATSQ
jgi:N-acetylmuramoyl-L-alanine amidase